MKIAILTQPLHTNYGGILQSYALQTFLQKRGHEVIVVNRDYNNPITIKILLLRLGSVIKSVIRLVLLRKKEYVVMNPFSPFYHALWTGYNVLPFVENYINHSKEIRTSKALKDYFMKNNFDCYIVGSDQVWRPCYSPGITDFFLKEVPEGSKALKLAYSVSFGTDKWEFSDLETKECSTLAKQFNSISVREKSGIQLCEKYLGVRAEHVLDPTMLLEAEDYIRLFEEDKAQKSKGNLFCYMLDANRELESIVSYLQTKGFISVNVTISALPTKDNDRPYQMSVEEWLRGIYEAEFIVTDSFHACVFSIIFKKPFVVLGNKERGNARFDSLLEMFGLQHRRIESSTLFMSAFDNLKHNCDLVAAQSLLSNYRAISMAFFEKQNV